MELEFDIDYCPCCKRDLPGRDVWKVIEVMDKLGDGRYTETVRMADTIHESEREAKRVCADRNAQAALLERHAYYEVKRVRRLQERRAPSALWYIKDGVTWDVLFSSTPTLTDRPFCLLARRECPGWASSIVTVARDDGRERRYSLPPSPSAAGA